MLTLVNLTMRCFEYQKFNMFYDYIEDDWRDKNQSFYDLVIFIAFKEAQHLEFRTQPISVCFGFRNNENEIKKYANWTLLLFFFAVCWNSEAMWIHHKQYRLFWMLNFHIHTSHGKNILRYCCCDSEYFFKKWNKREISEKLWHKTALNHKQ